MLNQEEIDFIKHWEAVRIPYSSVKSKFMRGLPMASLFTLPILFSLAAVYFLSPDWYTKISQKVSGESAVILISVFLITLFFAFIRMHFKWEMNEQLYNELKFKSQKNNPTN